MRFRGMLNFYTKCKSLSLKFGLRAQRKQFTVIIIVNMLLSKKCNVNRYTVLLLLPTAVQDEMNVIVIVWLCVFFTYRLPLILYTLNLLALHFSYLQFHQMLHYYIGTRNYTFIFVRRVLFFCCLGKIFLLVLYSLFIYIHFFILRSTNAFKFFSCTVDFEKKN